MVGWRRENNELKRAMEEVKKMERFFPFSLAFPLLKLACSLFLSGSILVFNFLSSDILMNTTFFILKNLG